MLELFLYLEQVSTLKPNCAQKALQESFPAQQKQPGVSHRAPRLPLEHQHNIGQVGSLDLRDSRVVKFVQVSPGSVEAEAFARSYPACSTGALVGRLLERQFEQQQSLKTEVMQSRAMLLYEDAVATISSKTETYEYKQLFATRRFCAESSALLSCAYYNCIPCISYWSILEYLLKNW